MANIVLNLSGGTTNITPSLSIGGARSTQSGAIIDTSNTTLNNLWDDISKVENINGVIDYRCVYVYNNTATSGQIYANGAAYISGSALATFALGFVAAKNTDAGTIANENTAPSGITFTAPTSGSPLAFLASSNILNPGDYIALWIRRTANNITGSGTVTDSLTLTLSGAE